MADQWAGLRRVREGRHQCPLLGWGEPGEIVDCVECGRRWKFVHPGNPHYAGWRQTVLSMLGVRHRG